MDSDDSASKLLDGEFREANVAQDVKETSTVVDQASDSVGNMNYPSTLKYIIGNEFCERFSFYGMRAILALYLNNQLGLSEGASTEAVHLFIVAAYVAPLIGAFISDSYWGKYKTILYLSLIYCLGNWLLSFSALKADNVSALHWAAAGLACLAFGSGGIKPCVSSFGGDQIELTMAPGQARDRLIRSFFSYFYFSINVGATFSTIITPWLREYVSYASAFGLPAVLMLVATFIFWLGRNEYVHQAPGGNIISEVAKVVISAVNPKSRPIKLADVEASESADVDGQTPLVRESGSRRGSRRQVLENGAVGTKPLWLDAAKATHGEEKVEDIKLLFRVLTLFLPVPIFWSLFDQQASRWVFQAEKMNGNLPFGMVVFPDQMQTLNSIFILIMIPLFDQWIYPSLEKMGVSVRPIPRMAWGMVLGALSFVVSALVQIHIESACHPSPSNSLSTAALSHGSFPGIEMTVHNASAYMSTGGSFYGSLDIENTMMGLDKPVPEKCVSMLWQGPQFVIMTAGEILFSITGLELAFSQAPASLKSVVSAFWCITVAAGNLFTVLVVGTIGPKLTQVQEFFFFAALCMLSVVLFLWVGSGFTYVESASDEIALDEGALAVDQPVPIMHHDTGIPLSS